MICSQRIDEDKNDVRTFRACFSATAANPKHIRQTTGQTGIGAIFQDMAAGQLSRYFRLTFHTRTPLGIFPAVPHNTLYDFRACLAKTI